VRRLKFEGRNGDGTADYTGNSRQRTANFEPSNVEHPTSNSQQPTANSHGGGGWAEKLRERLMRASEELWQRYGGLEGKS